MPFENRPDVGVRDASQRLQVIGVGQKKCLKVVYRASLLGLDCGQFFLRKFLGGLNRRACCLLRVDGLLPTEPRQPTNAQVLFVKHSQPARFNSSCSHGIPACGGFIGQWRALWIELADGLPKVTLIDRATPVKQRDAHGVSSRLQRSCWMDPFQRMKRSVFDGFQWCARCSHQRAPLPVHRQSGLKCCEASIDGGRQNSNENKVLQRV